MSKLVITRWGGAILTVTLKDGKPVQLDAEPDGMRSILGNIYIGKVKNIVKNINSAFVDLGDGVTGYLNLESPGLYYASGERVNGKLRAGDEIVVQVEREAVKTKDPVLTGNLNFAGRYCVLTSGKTQIGFSSRITDAGWKKRVKPLLEAEKEEDFGVIVRTNAPEVPLEALAAEFKILKALYRRTMENAAHRTCYSLLHETPPSYVSGIRDSLRGSLEEVVTDAPDIYEALHSYMAASQPEDLEKLSFYEDTLLPLGKLYRLEKTMEEALGRRVWLKSGGYLVIEPTEALTVIDVNTGKFAGKKTLRDTIMKINLEAAAEIGRQLRLRNLSGIIIIDFIDMEEESDKKSLVDALSGIVSSDPVRTTVVEITKLNLVEVTRKKIRRPLYEQVAQIKEKA